MLDETLPEDKNDFLGLFAQRKKITDINKNTYDFY